MADTRGKGDLGGITRQNDRIREEDLSASRIVEIGKTIQGLLLTQSDVIGGDCE